MANRHQRRKRAKAKREQILIGLAQAERSRQISEIVRANKAKPIERNYYPAVSNTAMIGTASLSQQGVVDKLYDAKTAKRIAKVKR